MNNILSIDPGNIESAYCILEEDTYRPIQFGKVDNYELIEIIQEAIQKWNITEFAIEMVASYGMAVGKEIFETCVWIGRYIQIVRGFDIKTVKIYRKDEKMNLCHNMKAKDSNIRQALIDRFGIVGKKNNPGWFYRI